MRPTTPTVRLAAVIATAALALHELRYLIGFGDHAGDALAARGHAYLPFAGGLTGLLLALAAAQLLGALDRARHTALGERTPDFLRLSIAMAVVLLAVYSGQELLEAALTPGAHVGPAALLADGGWTAIPLALAFGPATALALRGASRAVASVALRAKPPRFRPSRRGHRGRAAPARMPASVLARHLASRAPPEPRPST